MTHQRGWSGAGPGRSLPDFMHIWAYDFLRVWKPQQALMRDEQPKRKRRAG